MNVHQRTPASDLDVVVVGAGFAGLYLLHRLRGMGLTARAYEAGSDVGGTWFWNRYPGARCDIESMQYSYSFSDALQNEWKWSERFASQPEILRYAGHVADRFDLRRDIVFNTRVVGAAFNEKDAHWTVTTDTGEQVRARYCIMATGCLSTARLPNIKGIERFQGKTYHTGYWPHEGVDFTGKRVGVIGTGSSAIQAIPVIAEQAAQLTVFQRTPNFSIPSRNMPMSDDYESDWKQNYATRRRIAREESRNGVFADFGTTSAIESPAEARQREYEKRWETGGVAFMYAYNDLGTKLESNDTASAFVRAKIREIVKDPKVAEALAPKDYPIGTKRICVDTDYFATFNRPNVTLVDVREAAIEEVTPTGVRTSHASHDFDCLVFATGFDAMTGTLEAMDIRGRGNTLLRDRWTAGARTYLGLMVAGFPNLFMVTGPGSPSVLSNMIVSIEQHVEWITDCLKALRGATIESTQEAQDAWVDHVNERANMTLYPRAASWYMGANIPGKPRVFMPYIGGVGAYRKICDEVAADNYRGFQITHAGSGATTKRSAVA